MQKRLQGQRFASFCHLLWRTAQSRVAAAEPGEGGSRSTVYYVQPPGAALCRKAHCSGCLVGVVRALIYCLPSASWSVRSMNGVSKKERAEERSLSFTQSTSLSRWQAH